MTGILTNEQRIAAFSALGAYLTSGDPPLLELIQSSKLKNAWFTPAETERAITGISRLLNEPDLRQWFHTEFEAGTPGTALNSKTPSPKTIGLVLAGNIPLVGFHDVLTVLASGNIALIKLSSQDNLLLPFLLQKLVEIEPGFSGSFVFTDRLTDFDAVIATGSTNTSRYFDYYFSKYPNIIRKNRNSVAVLTGDETREQLHLLGYDIFSYFGLGCRNVSKIYIPAGYDLVPFFESIESFNKISDHHKYNNNYDYNKSIFLVNGDKHFDNGFLLVKEDERLASPLATLYFEIYDDRLSLAGKLDRLSGQLQCLVSAGTRATDVQHVFFGESQHPKLWDYADNVNTAAFLTSL